MTITGRPRTAAQDGRTHARAALGAILTILLLLAAGYALTVLVFQPGYMTVDARYVYDDAKAWNFGDWQSPVMGLLWWFIDPLAPGAWSMFLLIVTLYWLGFGVLALTVARRSAWLGIATPLLALMPPAFFLVGMIWRDVLFGVAWLVAAVLPFAVARASARARGCRCRRWRCAWSRFGVLLRPNAVVAAPILAAYVAWPARFDLKRAAHRLCPGAGALRRARSGRLLRAARRQAAEPAALDPGVRSRRHHPFQRREPVPGVVERAGDRAAHQQLLRSGALGQLLAHRRPAPS